jgi:histidinol-phosphate phosphatase family protein
MDVRGTAVSATVAILAGGGGTRLLERSGGLPKPMVPLAGRPLLEHQIERCRDAGFTRIALLVHFRHEAISAHFRDGSRFGVQIEYCVETAPRGTAGALRDALELLAPTFLVLYGDTYFDVDLCALWHAHERLAADATLLVHPNEHPHDSDLVELDDDAFVRVLRPYPRPAAPDRRNLVNAALYAMQREGLADMIPAAGTCDLAKHAFPAMLAAGRKLAAHLSVEYIKDVGTPQRLDRVEAEIARGLPERLSARHLRSAVFLDRDGTLNRDVGHLRGVDQVSLYADAALAVRRLNQNGTLAVVVTNQPVIARGEVTSEGLSAIHARLEALLGAEGAYVDRIYHCPHHPHRGFAGEVAALKIECGCRKPATGMIDAACRDLAIDRTRSWMVGDSTADIATGYRSGLKTILLRTGSAGSDAKHDCEPDYVMSTLGDAVDWIVAGHDAAAERLAPDALRALEVRLVLVGGSAPAGTCRAARVLAEIVDRCGRRAHVVSLDAWTLAAQRPECAGELRRVDAERAWRDIAAVVQSTRHETVRWPRLDLNGRPVAAGPARLIGPHDLLIVEGVEALLHAPLRELAGLQLNIPIEEGERSRHLEADDRFHAQLQGAP